MLELFVLLEVELEQLELLGIEFVDGGDKLKIILEIIIVILIFNPIIHHLLQNVLETLVIE